MDRSDIYTVVTENLTKVYRMGKVNVEALRGVDLRVRKGELMAVVGPSGSGKSTLLNLMGALDKPTTGRVFIDGVDVGKLSDFELADLRARKIGFVFQFFNLIHRMNALRNVALPMVFTGVSRREREERAMKLLELVGLRDKWRHRPSELSGGEQQRVAVARALANNPSIILADEPTGNLDTKTGEEIIGMLLKLNKGMGQTIVIVTHEKHVSDVCERIVYLRDGLVEREVVRKT